MPVSRKRKLKRPLAPPSPDPRSYPDTSLSPNTYAARAHALGNVLRAAKYGHGRRRQAGAVLVGIMVVVILLRLAMAFVQNI